MIPHRVIIAILAFLALVALLPLWTAVDPTGMPMEMQFLAGITLPGVVLIYVVSWIQPDLAAPIVGLFVLLGLIVIFPTLFDFTQLASNEVDGFGGTIIQLALPAILTVFVLTIAHRRFFA